MPIDSMETILTSIDFVRAALERARGRLRLHGTERPAADGLFDRVVAPATLAAAWRRVRANGGAPGRDRMSTAGFAAFADRRIARLSRSMISGHYKPDPPKHVTIPKANGGERRLSIPTVRDRIAQTAAAMVLSAEFDPTMSPASYGYRPGRSVGMAVDRVRTEVANGNAWAVDGDIETFFDVVPHEPLMDLLRRRIADERMLRLIRVWLDSFSVDGRGLAQGSPISPLLSNIYLDILDRRVARWRWVKWVRYADDFLLLCSEKNAAERARHRIARELRRNGLRLNAEKTRIVRVENGLVFLGHRFEEGQVESVAGTAIVDAPAFLGSRPLTAGDARKTGGAIR